MLLTFLHPWTRAEWPSELMLPLSCFRSIPQHDCITTTDTVTHHYRLRTYILNAITLCGETKNLLKITNTLPSRNCVHTLELHRIEDTVAIKSNILGLYITLTRSQTSLYILSIYAKLIELLKLFAISLPNFSRPWSWWSTCTNICIRKSQPPPPSLYIF
jgi:hypothetical protein